MGCHCLLRSIVLALVESEVSLSEDQGAYKDITLRVSLFKIKLPPRKCIKEIVPRAIEKDTVGF